MAGHVAVLLVAGAVTWTSPAIAYPQYIGKSEINCSDCHYSPTGGGLINSWGRESRDSSFDFGDSALWPGHDDADGKGIEEAPALEFDVGGDGRLLPLIATGAGPTSVVMIPMLAEVGAVAVYDPWMLYATASYRKGTPSGSPVLVFSREHWLGYRITDDATIRAGRVVLPFGIRTPDHTQYVREDFDFDKWDQSYALEFDWIRDDISLSLALFAGDPLYEPAELRPTGGVVRASYAIATEAEFGISALGSRATTRDRLAGSVFTRLNPWGSSYLLGEFALQRFALRRTDDSLSTSAAFARAGWFVLPALDVYLEGGWRTLSGTGDFDKLRYALGANWQVLQWFELIPQVMAEKQEGVGTELFAMAQIHLTY